MKNLVRSAYLITIVGLLACSKQQNSCLQGEKLTNVACTEQYSPVCGCNGKTYSNACHANVDGIKEYTEGECP